MNIISLNKSISLIVLTICLIIFSNGKIYSQTEHSSYRSAQDYSKAIINIDYIGEIRSKHYVLSASGGNMSHYEINVYDDEFNLVHEYKIKEYYKITFNVVKVIIIDEELYIFNSSLPKKAEKQILYLSKLKLVDDKYEIMPGIQLVSSDIWDINVKVVGATYEFNVLRNTDPFTFIYSPNNEKLCVLATQSPTEMEDGENFLYEKMEVAIIDLNEMKVIYKNDNLNVGLENKQAIEKVSLSNDGQLYLVGTNIFNEEKLFKLYRLDYVNDNQLNEIDLSKTRFKDMRLFNKNGFVYLGALYASEDCDKNLPFDSYFEIELNKGTSLIEPTEQRIDDELLKKIFEPILSGNDDEEIYITNVKFHKHIYANSDKSLRYLVIEAEYQLVEEKNFGPITFVGSGKNILLVLCLDAHGNIEASTEVIRNFVGKMGILKYGNERNFMTFVTGEELFLYYDVIFDGENDTKTICVKINDDGEKELILLDFLNDDNFKLSYFYFETENYFVFEMYNELNKKLKYIEKQ